MKIVRSQTPSHEGFRGYLRLIARRKWIIVAATVAVPTGAVAVSLSQTAQYEGSAQVLLSRQNISDSLTGQNNVVQGTDFDRIAQTQAELAHTPDVAARVLQVVPNAHISVDGFLSQSEVGASQDTDLLDFKVRFGSAIGAQRLATVYAEQFTRFRRMLDTSALERARVDLDARITTLRRDARQNQALLARLIGKEQELRTFEALQTSNAFVVREAKQASKIRPKPVRSGVLGLLLGVILGVGIAALRDMFDTRIRNAEDIGNALEIPLLARIAEPDRRLGPRAVVMRQRPGAVSAESFRMLRTSLDFVNLDDSATSYLVTSAVAGEGKSTTAANLATALALAGRDVVLVDLDLRKARIAGMFELQSAPGITEVALGRLPLAEALNTVPLQRDPGASRGNDVGRLRVLTAGIRPPEIGDFVSSAALAEVVLGVKRKAEIVVLDSPPLLSVSDAISLSKHVDGMILVTRLKLLKWPALRELHRLLGTSPVRVLGYVVTAAQLEERYGYGYAYGYGYKNRSGELLAERADSEADPIPLSDRR